MTHTVRTAGKFEAEITDPHPVWVRLSYDGRHLVNLHHNELLDLRHVVNRAIEATRRNLGKDAGEMG